MAINLGDINFGLGPDTRRLDAARQSILKFGQTVNRVAQSQAEGARQTETALRRQEKAVLSALQSTLNLNKSIRASGTNANLINTTTNSFNRLTKELTRGKVSALTFQRAMEDFQASVGRVKRQINAVEKETKALQAAQAKQAADSVRAILKQERAYHSAEMAVIRYNTAVARLPEKHQTLFAGGADRAASQLRSGIGAAGTDPLAFQRAQQQFSKSMAILNKDVSAFAAKAHNAAFSGLEVGLRRLSDVAILLHGPLGGIAARLSLISHVAESVSLKMAGLVLGISAAAFAFSKLATGAIAANKIFDKINQSLIALTGSQAQATAHLDYVSTVADRAGSRVDTLAASYTRLVAASQGTNLAGAKTREIFENIVVAGQKLGMSNEDLGGTLKAVEQMMSKGKIQAEELRGQLGDRLPGAVNIMAESLGVSTAKLNDMMKQGKLTSDALVGFADTLAKRLGVNATTTIDTLVAAENRLYNAFLRFRLAADESIGFSDAYKAALNAITGALVWLTDNIDTAISALYGLAAAASLSLALIYGPTVITGFIAVATAIWGVVTATGALSTALVVLRGAMIKTGIGALVVGFGVLVYWISETSRKVGGLGILFGHLKDIAKESFGKVVDAIKWIGEAADWAANRLSFMFLSAIADVLQAFQDLTWAIADGFNSIFGTSIAGVNIDPVINSTNDLADTMWVAAESSGRAMDSLAASIDAPLKSLTALKNAMMQATSTPPAIVDPLNSGNTNTGTGTGGGGGEAGNAIRDALQSIQDLQEEMEILMMPKWQQAWARIQKGINDQIDDFRNKLLDAKVPQEQVVALTKQYADNLRLLEEAKYTLETQVTLWETLATSISNGFDSAVDAIVNGLKTGEKSFEALRDVARNVVADILKSFIQLAWVNPLKNFLFGGDPSTGMPFPTFGGFKAKGGPLNPNQWYIAGENGPEPIWGGGQGAFAFSNADQMASHGQRMSSSGGRSSSGGAGQTSKLQIGVSVDEDGKWQAHVKKLAGDVAGLIVQTGLEQYDQVLPTRVNAIANDPWKR